MDDNERHALAEVRREQEGLANSSDDTPSSGESAWYAISRVVGAVVLIGGVAFAFLLATDECFRFKVGVASGAGSDALTVMLTPCQKGPQGCSCSSSSGRCGPVHYCSFSERDPTLDCGTLLTECVNGGFGPDR